MIVVRDREAGNIIEQVGSWKEGLNTIKEFEHNGYAYISFDDMRSNFCVIHSPDCPCSGKEVQE
jgi:hypothetical protein